MSEIDRYLDEVCRTLGGSHDLRAHVREELKDHLTDAVEANIARGLSQEEATKKAIEDFGRPEETRSGLQALYGRSATSFLIDRAMAWKERTMKSGWKWSFAAMSILLFVMATQLFLTAAAFVFLYPRLTETYTTLGAPLPRVVLDTLRVAQVFRNELLLLWGLPAAVAAVWALFEWRCKSENKPIIRLAGASLATLLVTAVFCFVAVVTIIGLALQASSAFWLDPRPLTLRVLSDAERAMPDLRSAMADKDRERTWDASSRLAGALRTLSESRSAVALASTINQAQVERLQSTVNRMLEQTRILQTFREPKELNELEATWSIFQRQLKGESVEVPPPFEEPYETEDRS